ILCLARRMDDARLVLKQIANSQDQARQAGEQDALLDQSEEFICQAVTLSVAWISIERWEQLHRLLGTEQPPIVQIEFLEFMAISVLEQGARDRATTLLREALDLSRQTSHLIENRLREQLSRIAATDGL
ncbi:MAG: hypothetical protein AAGC55_14170, partial [Myxococcota bacterium]